MYLLDTNVVAELRWPRPRGAVVAWLESVADADLHLSAVTIGEIQAGIELTRERDAAKADEIEAWLEKSLRPSVFSPWMPVAGSSQIERASGGRDDRGNRECP